MQKPSISIIGAGVSGLIAAFTCEEEGYSPVIYEATDRTGGRVRTDMHGKYYLDHGFQVLLTAYPEAKRYLDFHALELEYFKPGAIIFQKGKKERIGDPLRDPGSLWPTLKSKVATLTDKWLIFRLSEKLKRTDLATIFTSPELTTLQYLKNYGFSEKVISNFFQPFFTGIFLEPELKTSSRMFEFVFKMFSEGKAAIPKKGIAGIAQQLTLKLQNTRFEFNCPVQKISGNEIHLPGDKTITSDLIINTVPGLNPEINLQWKNCTNLYFQTENQHLSNDLIALLPGNSIINNIAYPFDQKDLLSVTVVKDHNYGDAELIDKVEKELSDVCGIQVKSFIKLFHIKQALPDISNLSMYSEESGTQSSTSIFQAGDYLFNGSLNAAMYSGRKAAEEALSQINPAK
ncbi:FAD-dependent oxidoreductase [Robertkochia aurantiaca]|uniref:FAD-dependent oxidoreductase n=1 Tax=Robertkochia aurantiaca TaxID=2873700 RepID=UPI001CCA5310|nr:FAD-dependent oxidoreductase [Robertkochia sp. 3YJGBD-33]